MSEHAIQAEHIKMRYGTVEILRGLSFSVPKSKFAALIGKSGSGKSTLLGLISGLEKPSEGHIRIENTEITALDSDSLTRLRRNAIGIIFQNFNLIPSLTALENVLLPGFANGTPKQTRQRATELLAAVGLANRREHRPAALSGGEQQRVAIARALINSPSILLADEPTGNLDEANSAAILDLLLGICRDQGATLLMATHDLDIAAKANITIEIRDGKIDHVNS